MAIKLGTGFNVQANVPLDDRTVFATGTEAIEFARNNRNRLYPGLMASIQNSLHFWTGSSWESSLHWTHDQIKNNKNSINSITSDISKLKQELGEGVVMTFEERSKLAQMTLEPSLETADGKLIVEMNGIRTEVALNLDSIKSDIDTLNQEATSQVKGLMSPSDKIKLDSLTSQFEINSEGDDRISLTLNGTAKSCKLPGLRTVIDEVSELKGTFASDSNGGLMSQEDKTKLDSLTSESSGEYESTGNLKLVINGRDVVIPLPVKSVTEEFKNFKQSISRLATSSTEGLMSGRDKSKLDLLTSDFELTYSDQGILKLSLNGKSDSVDIPLQALTSRVGTLQQTVDRINTEFSSNESKIRSVSNRVISDLELQSRTQVELLSTSIVNRKLDEEYICGRNLFDISNRGRSGQFSHGTWTDGGPQRLGIESRPFTGDYQEYKVIKQGDWFQSSLRVASIEEYDQVLLNNNSGPFSLSAVVQIISQSTITKDNLSIQLACDGTPNGFDGNPNTTNVKWIRNNWLRVEAVSQKATNRDNPNTYSLLFRFWDKTSNTLKIGDFIRIWYPKVELGTRATDWQPHRSAILRDISALSSRLEGIEPLKDKLQTIDQEVAVKVTSKVKELAVPGRNLFYYKNIHGDKGSCGYWWDESTHDTLRLRHTLLSDFIRYTVTETGKGNTFHIRCQVDSEVDKILLRTPGPICQSCYIKINSDTQFTPESIRFRIIPGDTTTAYGNQNDVKWITNNVCRVESTYHKSCSDGDNCSMYFMITLATPGTLKIGDYFDVMNMKFERGSIPTDYTENFTERFVLDRTIFDSYGSLDTRVKEVEKLKSGVNLSLNSSILTVSIGDLMGTVNLPFLLPTPEVNNRVDELSIDLTRDSSYTIAEFRVPVDSGLVTVKSLDSNLINIRSHVNISGDKVSIKSESLGIYHPFTSIRVRKVGSSYYLGLTASREVEGSKSTRLKVRFKEFSVDPIKVSSTIWRNLSPGSWDKVFDINVWNSNDRYVIVQD